MSRIGKKPVPVPKGVTVTLSGNSVSVKGPKGELARTFHPEMSLVMEGDNVTVSRPSDETRHKALHGLSRTLLANMVEGVTKGFTKNLELVGVGYKAEKRPYGLQLSLGYSHPIEYALPEGIEAKTERVNTKTSINQYQLTITLSGIDKQKLGQVAAELNRLRKPDAYKGKGVRYSDKFYKLKPGKTGK